MSHCGFRLARQFMLPSSSSATCVVIYFAATWAACRNSTISLIVPHSLLVVMLLFRGVFTLLMVGSFGGRLTGVLVSWAMLRPYASKRGGVVGSPHLHRVLRQRILTLSLTASSSSWSSIFSTSAGVLNCLVLQSVRMLQWSHHGLLR